MRKARKLQDGRRNRIAARTEVNQAKWQSFDFRLVQLNLFKLPFIFCPVLRLRPPSVVRRLPAHAAGHTTCYLVDFRRAGLRLSNGKYILLSVVATQSSKTLQKGRSTLGLQAEPESDSAPAPSDLSSR